MKGRLLVIVGCLLMLSSMFLIPAQSQIVVGNYLFHYSEKEYLVFGNIAPGTYNVTTTNYLNVAPIGHVRPIQWIEFNLTNDFKDENLSLAGNGYILLYWGSNITSDNYSINSEGIANATSAGSYTEFRMRVMISHVPNNITYERLSFSYKLRIKSSPITEFEGFGFEASFLSITYGFRLQDVDENATNYHIMGQDGNLWDYQNWTLAEENGLTFIYPGLHVSEGMPDPNGPPTTTPPYTPEAYNMTVNKTYNFTVSWWFIALDDQAMVYDYGFGSSQSGSWGWFVNDFGNMWSSWIGGSSDYTREAFEDFDPAPILFVHFKHLANTSYDKWVYLPYNYYLTPAFNVTLNQTGEWTVEIGWTDDAFMDYFDPDARMWYYITGTFEYELTDHNDRWLCWMPNAGYHHLNLKEPEPLPPIPLHPEEYGVGELMLAVVIDLSIPLILLLVLFLIMREMKKTIKKEMKR